MQEELKPYYICTVCNVKIRDNKWNEHIETKRHHNAYEKTVKKGYIFDKLIFDSEKYGCKRALLFTFLPKYKWGKRQWKMM